MTANLFQPAPIRFSLRTLSFACGCANQCQVQDAGTACELCGGRVPMAEAQASPQQASLRAVKRLWIMPQEVEQEFALVA